MNVCPRCTGWDKEGRDTARPSMDQRPQAKDGTCERCRRNQRKERK